MNNLHRISINPVHFAKTLVAADPRFAKLLIQGIKEQLTGTDKRGVNKPFGRGKEVGEDGAYCAAFLATYRETGEVCTSYSEAKRRNADAEPAADMKDSVFINLRQQKGQAAQSGVDAATMAEVMALADEAEAPVSEADVDAELDAVGL